MKIKTENFLVFKKFIQTNLASKDDNTILGKFIYLDFENSIFHFASTEFIGKFVMCHTVKDIDNFYVSATEFLSLCDVYDSLIIDKNFNFYDPNDKENVFKLNYRFEDPLDFKVDYNQLEKFVISSKDFKNISDSLSFMVLDNNNVRNLNGIRIYEDNIYSSTGYSLYKAKLESLDLKKDKMDLTSSVVKAIKSLPFESVNIYFDFDKLSVYIKDDNDILEIKFLSNNELSLPEEDGLEKLKKTYEHKYKLVVEKETILNELDMLSPFVTNVVNEQVYLHVDSEDYISFKVESLNIIKHKMPIIEIDSNQIGYGFWVSRQFLYSSISVIEDETIEINLNLTLNKNLRAIKITGLTNKNKMVALSTMR